jgi:hypothetical protein
VLGSSHTTTDLNALFFDRNGNYLFALQDLNRLSGKPFEIGGFHGRGGLQIVIAKANTDAGSATQLRYQIYDGLEARSTSSRWRRASTATRWPAARPRSRPSIRSGRCCRRTTRRSAAICRSISTRPAIACRSPTSARAAGRGDRRREHDVLLDRLRARSGHAAQLLRNQRGGTARGRDRGAGAAGRRRPKSVSPDAMRSLLQRSTFDHDLDVYHARAPREA